MLGKGYWIYIFYLTSIVIVGIGGFLIGGAETPPKFLASVGEALSNIFGEGGGDFVEVLDVGEYDSVSSEEEARVIDTLGKEKVTLVGKPTVNAQECVFDPNVEVVPGDVVINEIAWMGGLE